MSLRTALFAAIALAALAVPCVAVAQQCPATQIGQACNGGAGSCVASMCTTDDDAGVQTPVACGFCEPVTCPMTEVGQPCEGGTCTQATCRAADDAGQETQETCAVCTGAQPGACSAAQSGQLCADGGVCTMMSTRALGPAGALPPSDLFYPIWVCYEAPEAGGVEVDASLGLAHSVGDASSADTGTPAAAASGGSGSSGCDVSEARANGSGGYAGLLFAAIVVAGSRRRSRYVGR
jgi:hypothetical protein